MASKKVSGSIVDKVEEENMSSKEATDLSSPTRLIKSILLRFVGDSLFQTISLSMIGEVLYENFELYKIFVYCLMISSKEVKEYVIYSEELNPRTVKKLRNANFRSHPEFDPKSIEWNFGLIFKAYSNLLQFGLDTTKGKLTLAQNFDSKLKIIRLRDEDYYFINYCFGENLNPKWTENWKLGFLGFSKYILQDLINVEKCERSLKIIEKFLNFDQIQKQISEEIYEQLMTLIRDIISLRLESCYSKVVEYLNKISQSQNCSTMLKDSLRRLLELKFD